MAEIQSFIGKNIIKCRPARNALGKHYDS